MYNNRPYQGEELSDLFNDKFVAVGSTLPPLPPYGGNYDVVCVYETWLNNLILSSEILPNYGSIFRCDRADRIGGGVLVAVKTGIQVTRRHDLERDNTELVVTELLKSNNKPIILYTFYAPPPPTLNPMSFSS